MGGGLPALAVDADLEVMQALMGEDVTAMARHRPVLGLMPSIKPGTGQPVAG